MKHFKENELRLPMIILVTIVSFVLAFIYSDSFNVANWPSYTSISANSDLINYYGRWTAASDRLGKLASFPGSSIEFAIHNTSLIILDLANVKIAPKAKSQILQSTGVALTPAKTKTARYGPVDILLTVNDTVKLQRLNGIYGKTLVLQDLRVDDTHKIRIKLLHRLPYSTIHLRAIVLEEGGRLIPTSRFLIERNSLSSESFVGATNQSPVRNQNRVLEVLTPISTSGFRSLTHQDDNEHTLSWLDLLEHEFASTKVSVLPTSNETCLSRFCQTHNPMAPQVKDVYFRAGVPGTQLHERLWSPATASHTPAALLMMLGLTDMNVLLQKSNGTKHQAVQFIEDLARSYSNLIQMIRRTAYSSSVLSTMQPFSYDNQDQIDESYLYNSSPSNVPIFLIIPPIPITEDRSKSRYIRSLFSQVLQKVLNELKWHIGDKQTFVLDTAGWLEEEDFADRALDFSLTQVGHVKFAYKLSLHLCHYLLDRVSLTEAPRCPFDRYDEYVGNLYVPETASIGKLIEEKKVMRMKKMFGIIDRGNKEIPL